MAIAVKRKLFEKETLASGKSGRSTSKVPESLCFDQPFLYPRDLFGSQSGSPVFWTCVRTRPRWEKKFADWLTGSRIRNFLPIYQKTTVSHRKRRTTQLPLFPGYVFAEGKWTKSDFSRTNSVARVIRPEEGAQAVQLHEELWNIWRGLVSGLYVSPVDCLAQGEYCRIINGSMAGCIGRFERAGRNGSIVLQVDILGCGVAVEVGHDDVEVIE